jgi:hypothetical protein
MLRAWSVVAAPNYATLRLSYVKPHGADKLLSKKYVGGARLKTLQILHNLVLQYQSVKDSFTLLFMTSSLYRLLQCVLCRCVLWAAMLWATLCAVFAVYDAHAQQPAQAFVAIWSDTAVVRGAVVRVAVRVQAPQAFAQTAQIDSLRVVVAYNPNLLALRSIHVPPQGLLRCSGAALRVDSVFLSSVSGRLGITCAVLSPQVLQQAALRRDTLTLFVAEFGTLVGSDSLARLRLDSLLINARPQVVINPTTATIIVRGTPLIVDRFAEETLEQNAPNPSDGTTAFAYNIISPTSVDFTLFNALGQVVIALPTLNRTRGRYTLQLFSSAEIPSGMYLLRMVTRNGVYSRTLQVVK